MILNLSLAVAWAQISKILCKPRSWFTHLVGCPQGAAKTPASPCSLRWAQISQVCPLPASCLSLSTGCSDSFRGRGGLSSVQALLSNNCSMGVLSALVLSPVENTVPYRLLLWRKLSLPNLAQPVTVVKSLVQRSVLAVLQKKEYLVALGTLRSFFTEMQLQRLQHALGAGQSLQYCPEVEK